MKKFLSTVLISVLALTLTTGCNKIEGTSSTVSSGPSPVNFDKSKSISVISREDGSGTRGAFIELFGIEVKTPEGTKKDMTTKEAIIVDKTDMMLTNIASDTYAIGYVSLGSLNQTIKPLDIDGVKASPENVKNDTYKIKRPFNIATKGEPTGLSKDFISFIFSKEGQAVVAKSYIAIESNAPAYAGTKPSGKITIGGSSSVNPLMEKLKEAYMAINKNATIEIQVSDSTSGMTGAMNGTFDIGMASRNLKDNEKSKLTEKAIALDGIAVIVNNKNLLAGLTSKQVESIFTGKSTKWSELTK